MCLLSPDEAFHPVQKIEVATMSRYLKKTLQIFKIETCCQDQYMLFHAIFQILIHVFIEEVHINIFFNTLNLD